MRVVTNDKPESFAQRFRTASGVEGDITWQSPLADDEYSEYYDTAFLERIGCGNLAEALKRFWPVSGPRWDGLATTSTGQVIIVEAKAHLDEVITDCKAGKESLMRIHASLEDMKRTLKIPESRLQVSWVSPYYQFCNRVAHLAFLRDHGVDAHLVFLAFADAPDVSRPVSELSWREHARHIRHSMALHAHSLIKYDHDIIIPVSEIETVK